MNYRVEIENDPGNWQVHTGGLSLADANHLADSLENVNTFEVRVVEDRLFRVEVLNGSSNVQAWTVIVVGLSSAAAQIYADEFRAEMPDYDPDRGGVAEVRIVEDE